MRTLQRAPLRLVALAALVGAVLGFPHPAVATEATEAQRTTEQMAQTQHGSADPDGQHHGDEQGGHHRGGEQGESSGSSGGIPLAVWIVFGLGGAALLFAAVALRTSIAGRLVLAGIGVQLVGLGWDAALHARRGEHIGLFENVGHLVSLAGLALVAITALVIIVPREWRGRARRELFGIRERARA